MTVLPLSGLGRSQLLPLAELPHGDHRAGMSLGLPGKMWQSRNIFLGKIIPHGDVFLALSPCASPQGLCPDGCQHPMGDSIPRCSMGLDPAQGPGAVCGVWATRLLQVRVSLPPRVAPLGQASSLPSVSMPGVQQEDFHCC